MSSKGLKRYVEAVVDPYITSLGNVQKSLLSTISSLVTLVNNKADKNHTHSKSTLPNTTLYTDSTTYTDLVAEVNNKSNKNHTHTKDTLPSDVVYTAALTAGLATKSDVGHTHEYSDMTDNGPVGTMPITNGTESGIVFEDIIKYAYVSETTEEVDQAKVYEIPNKTLVDTWKKLSNRGPTQPGVASELDTWTYDESTDVLQNTTNSISYLAYYSPEIFTDYTFEVLLTSTSGDDDILSVVAAASKDENGFVHTLSFMRCPGGAGSNNGTWFLVYNYGIANSGTKNSWTIVKSSGGIEWGNGNLGITKEDAGYTEGLLGGGWANKSGTKIKVQRTGNTITAVTTNWSDINTYVEDERLTIDLTSNPRLSIFINGGSIGVGTCSQPNSKFNILNFVNPSRNIYDMTRDGLLIAYDPENNVWVDSVDNETIYDAIGQGRLVFNKITNKLFHIADGYITKLSG